MDSLPNLLLSTMPIGGHTAQYMVANRHRWTQLVPNQLRWTLHIDRQPCQFIVVNNVR